SGGDVVYRLPFADLATALQVVRSRYLPAHRRHAWPATRISLGALAQRTSAMVVKPASCGDIVVRRRMPYLMFRGGRTSAQGLRYEYPRPYSGIAALTAGGNPFVACGFGQLL